MELYDNVRRLVTQNNTKEALEVLIKAIDDNAFADEVIMQSARLNHLEEELRQNLISFGTADLHRNKINKSILEFIRLLKDKSDDYPKNWTGVEPKKLSSVEIQLNTIESEFESRYLTDPQKAITDVLDQLFLLIREAQKTFNDQIFIEVKNMGGNLFKFINKHEDLDYIHFKNIFLLIELGIHNKFSYFFTEAQIDKHNLINVPAYSHLILALRLLDEGEFSRAKEYTRFLSDNPLANYVEGVCNRELDEKGEKISVAEKNLKIALELIRGFKEEFYPFLDLSINQNFLKASIYTVLAKINRKRREFDQSEDFFEKATHCALLALKEIEPSISINKQPSKNKILVAHLYDHYKILADIHFSYGYYWYENQNFEKAESYFLHSIDAIKKSGDEWDSPYTRMGIIHFCDGKIESAYNYFSKARTICSNTFHKNDQAPLSFALCSLGISAIKENYGYGELDDNWEQHLNGAIRSVKYQRKPLECHRNDARFLQQNCSSEKAKGLVKRFINILQVELQEGN